MHDVAGIWLALECARSPGNAEGLYLHLAIVGPIRARTTLERSDSCCRTRLFVARDDQQQFRRSESARRCCAIRNGRFSAAGPCFARSNRTLATAVADAFHNASCFVEIPDPDPRF